MEVPQTSWVKFTDFGSREACDFKEGILKRCFWVTLGDGRDVVRVGGGWGLRGREAGCLLFGVACF
jgi:hypothetical protein